MDLDAYFERIGYDGAPRPDERTLFELHEAHLESIPYENLDLQLGQEKPLDEASFERRLVQERRGGWCYEMNGLFSLALRQIGFQVDRLGGAVARDLQGEASIATHMVLGVDLGGRRLVADVGLGDGPRLPFPMEAHDWDERGFAYRFFRGDDGWWRFENHEHGLAPSFEFQDVPRALGWFQARCTHLQTDPSSPFLFLALVFRRYEKRVLALRDLTLLEIEGPTRTERTLDTRDAFARAIAEMVGLDTAEAIDALWTKISTRVAERRAAAQPDLEIPAT